MEQNSNRGEKKKKKEIQVYFKLNACLRREIKVSILFV